MRTLFRLLVVLVLLVAIGFGIAWFAAGRATPPVIEIQSPAKVIGQKGTLTVSVQAPRGKFTAVTVAVEQNGKETPLFSLSGPGTATVAQETADRIRISEPFGKQAVPALTAGDARIVATATRPSFFGLREVSATMTRDIKVQLTAPLVQVVSTKHYINLGGSEFIIYRVNPPDVESGVKVGDIVYRGFSAQAAGIPHADPGLKIAFFALRYDQDLNTPMEVFARDEAGNEGTAQFDHQVFPKTFRRSTIDINDAFLQRVVPPIIQQTPQLGVSISGPGDLLPAFLKANGELRRIDAQKIASYAAQTAPRMLWNGPFIQLGNSAVESAFADHRTYLHDGKEIDQQVHLGFDLAVTSNVPVAAANDGTIVHASYLGIYGNCIIIDHGLGVQSLYGHLSSFAVKVGDTVKKGQIIGHSGATGMAGGDHLHFTMLVDGQMVNPVEWWDAHWIADRVLRKLDAVDGESQAAAVDRPAAEAPHRRARRRHRG
ncbi:MAG TPA: M23 family metallopeptidase [Vicinamibacterales bacterium]|jgi:murein DD-endopeptidase MepM/ murein hydrolase activator NlpD